MTEFILPPGVKKPSDSDATGTIDDHNQMVAWFTQGMTDFAKMMYIDPELKKFTEDQRRTALQESYRRQLDYLESGGQ